jgi:flagellar biosynthesis/type III secretory pathway M-ring protein FliF/YscJ
MSTGDIVFIVAIVAVVAALVIWIATISARAKRMSAVSDARLATELQALAANPPAATPTEQENPSERAGQAAVADSKEDRLLELAELHSKSLISDDELATARAKILAE